MIIHNITNSLINFIPDLVISGINHGPNMGDDTIYSGTVAAAMEGYLLNIPSFAISILYLKPLKRINSNLALPLVNIFFTTFSF